jgi:peptidoglycan/LPS O-acetylase OafA/YrhL
MEMRQHGSGFGGWFYDLPWGSGVDVFFIISGFIMLFISGSVPRRFSAATDFLIKRILRIVPLYWFFTFAMAAVVLISPSDVSTSTLFTDELARSLLFIPYAPVGRFEMVPLLGQGWTLNYELFFYALFAFVLALTLRRYLWATVSLAALATVGAVVPLPPAIAFLCHPMLLLFIAGLVLARWHEVIPRHGFVVVLALLAAAIVWSVTIGRTQEQGTWLRLGLRGLPAIALVYALLFWRNPPGFITHGIFPLLGDASYALYLSHPFVVNALLIVFAKLGLPLDFFFAVVSVAASVLVSVVVFMMLERPFLRWTTRVYKESTIGRRLGARLPVRTDSLAFKPGTIS